MCHSFLCEASVACATFVVRLLAGQKVLGFYVQGPPRPVTNPSLCPLASVCGPGVGLNNGYRNRWSGSPRAHGRRSKLASSFTARLVYRSLLLQVNVSSFRSSTAAPLRRNSAPHTRLYSARVSWTETVHVRKPRGSKSNATT